MPPASQKIGLGTVQFGIDYGITNATGQTPPDEVQAIIDYAAHIKICTLDTAHLYGQSEAVLGQTIRPEHKFQIVTKTPDFDRTPMFHAGDAKALLEESFHTSLANLKVSSVYGLLVHNAGGFNGPRGQEIYDTLAALKQAGKVQKIGVSVYDAAQIELVLDHFGPLDLVQIPINLFDQRIIANGFLRRMKEHGIEIHARSLFLQGALLAPPSHVPPQLNAFTKNISAYHEFLQEHRLSPLRACLEFGLSLSDVDRLIIGVQTLENLREIMAIAGQGRRRDLDFSVLSCDNTALINPSKWPAP